MNRLSLLALFLAALVPSALIYAAMLGLGMHRNAPPWAISMATSGLVFGPALIAAAASIPTDRLKNLLGIQFSWACFLLLILPVYFPGERRQAVASGISLLGTGGRWEELAQFVAGALPNEPKLGEPTVPEATVVVPKAPPPPLNLEDHEIALPYEGRGRRLSVPVAFEHDGVPVETQMMLDTGATYTTLPTSVLKQLGIVPDDSDPVVKLHTANGEREARIVLLDKVWLGDLAIEGVAIAVCDVCGSGDNTGLLGLNVTGGTNLFIDADRREVVFSTREERDRHLDVAPFLDISANFTRHVGGRVEVMVRFDNNAQRTVSHVDARISCGKRSWLASSGEILPGRSEQVRRRLPPHDTCDSYQISMEKALW